MQVVLCDILTCRKEITPGQEYKLVIMNLQYDLCKECYEKFMSFIGEFLAPGVPALKTPGVTLQPMPQHTDHPRQTVDWTELLRDYTRDYTIPTYGYTPSYGHTSSNTADIPWIIFSGVNRGTY